MPAFDYVTDASSTWELFSLCVLSDRVFAIRQNTGSIVDWDVVEITGWPVDKEDPPTLTVRHDYTSDSWSARDLVIWQGTRLIALMWTTNNLEAWEYNLALNSWSSLGGVDNTDLGFAPDRRSVFGKDDDYIYLAAWDGSLVSAVYYSGDSFASEFGAGWTNGFDTWCAESGLEAANERRIQAIWADAAGNVHFYGTCTTLVPSSGPLYPADYDRFYSTTAAGVAFTMGQIAGGSKQLDCTAPFDPATAADFQMVFTIHRPDQEDIVFAIRASDSALVYSVDEGANWDTVSGTFDGSGTYSGANIYTQGAALNDITWQDTIGRWFALFSAEIVNSLEANPEQFTSLHIVTDNSGSITKPVFWWDRGTDMRVYYQTNQSATTDVRIYQWDTDENLAPAPPSSDYGPALIPRPADIDAAAEYLYIAALNGSNPVLLKMAAALNADATVVFNPGSGSDIGVECGRQDSEVVWIAGGFDGTNTVEVSDDGGGSFTVADDGSFNPVTAFEVGPGVDDDRMMIVDNAADAYETFDAGGSWFARGSALITDEVKSLRRLPVNPDEVLIGGEQAATDLVNYSPNALVSVSDISGVLPPFDVKTLVFE